MKEYEKMKIFRVLKPGFFTTVQDLGRFGYLKYGVPISGAMDTFSQTVANLLVGNKPEDATLEITLTGPELQALTRTQIAVTGGAISLKINGQKAPMWQTLEVQEGDIISFGKTENGCRVYLSVRGGINVPFVLGSRSTYVRGGFGGINGRPLESGDEIEGFTTSFLMDQYVFPEKLVPEFTGIYNVHVVLGPQADMFSEKGVNVFFSAQYTVTSESDRMGYRLEGPTVEHKAKADIVSDALLPGAIQVPKSGNPIIVMRDAPTSGGYAKIAVAITSDLSLLGQARPGATVIFSKITLREAQQKTREFYRLLRSLGNMLIKM